MSLLSRPQPSGRTYRDKPVSRRTYKKSVITDHTYWHGRPQTVISKSRQESPHEKHNHLSRFVRLRPLTGTDSLSHPGERHLRSARMVTGAGNPARSG